MGEGLSLEQIAIEMFYISAEAIRKKQWIVVTGWSPTGCLGRWMFGRWMFGRWMFGRWTLGRWTLGRWNLHYLAAPKATLGRSKRGCKNRLATHKGG